MPRPKSVESELRASFERLKNDEPKTLPKSTLVTLSNVAKEAGMLPTSLRKDRYPDLHREIVAYAEINTPIVKNRKVRKARESDSRRIKRLKTENETLLTIVNALTTLNEELEYENNELKKGNITRLG